MLVAALVTMPAKMTESVDEAELSISWTWLRPALALDLAILAKWTCLVPRCLRLSLSTRVNLFLLGLEGSAIVDDDTIDDDNTGAWTGSGLSGSLTSMTLRALGLEEFALASLLRSDGMLAGTVSIWF